MAGGERTFLSFLNLELLSYALLTFSSEITFWIGCNMNKGSERQVQKLSTWNWPSFVVSHWWQSWILFKLSNKLRIINHAAWMRWTKLYILHTLFCVKESVKSTVWSVHCIQYRVDCSSSAVFFPTLVFCCNFVPSVLNILLNTLLSYSLVLKLLYFIHFLELLQVYCYNPYLWISITLQGGDVLVSLLN